MELVKAGGWLMLPIIACSVVALAIIAERTGLADKLAAARQAQQAKKGESEA